MNWWLVATHLFAFLMGVWTCRVFLLRNFRAREVDGHVVIEYCRDADNEES